MILSSAPLYKLFATLVKRGKLVDLLSSDNKTQKTQNVPHPYKKLNTQFQNVETGEYNLLNESGTTGTSE